MLIGLSISAVALIGLLAYIAIGSALGCSEHDAYFEQRTCPSWFVDVATPQAKIVMLCAYFGPPIVLIASIVTLVSQRMRYLVTALALMGMPLAVLAVSVDAVDFG